MNNLIIFLIVLSGASAFANKSCSNSTGSLRLDEIGYNKGLPPRSGDLIRDVRISIEGQLVSESKDYQGQAPQLGLLTADFDQSSQKVLVVPQQGFGSYQVYAIKLGLKNVDSQNPIQNLPKAQYVICSEGRSGSIPR